MAGGRKDDDEEDDLETRIGGDSSAAPQDDTETIPPEEEEEPPTGESDPNAAPFEDDMISVPRQRPGAPQRTPLPPGASRPGATTPPGISRPAMRPPGASSPGARGPGTDDEDEKQTIHEGPYTELPTMQINVGEERDVETQAGGFAPDGSRIPRAGEEDDDQATMAMDASQAAEQQASLAADDQATIAQAPGTREKALLDEQSRSRKTPGHTTGDPRAASATQRSQGPVPASKYSRGTARDPIGGSAALRGTHPGARPAPTQLAEGMLLADRYELVTRLGKGGMGEVWQARHTLLQGMRAIKVIKASISRDPSFRARFLSEGQTMMRVKHPGVVEVTDLDETRQNRELFMVMEYLKGRTVHEAVRDEKRPLQTDLRDVVRIFKELADGMQRIHDEHIVHKDLKSDNVLLVIYKDGLEHPKIIDFGLAKRMDQGADVPLAVGAGDNAPTDDSQAGPGKKATSDQDTRTTLSGTLAYMAPEQFRGEPSSFQSDIYAFGVMLYECFMKGEYPMPRGSLADYMKRHTGGTIPQRLRQVRPDLDPIIAEIADRCMAPVQADRPVSFDEVEKALDDWLKIPARRKLRNQIILASSAALALVSVAVYGFFFSEGGAGISAAKLTAAGADLPRGPGNKPHLNAGVLTGLAFDGAPTKGKLGKALWEVDGAAQPGAFEVKDGRITAKDLDLTSLSDGAHELSFATGAGAPEAKIDIVVDRKAPTPASVRLADREGAITNAQSPIVIANVSDADVAKVYAIVGGEQISSDDAGDARQRRIAIPVQADGTVKVQVFAVDWAGNRSDAAEFSFVRDTEDPKVTPSSPDLLVDGRTLLVREASGNKIAGTTSEPVTLELSGQKTVVRNKGRFELAVPDVPPGGLATEIVARDDAGNVSKSTLNIKIAEDRTAVVDVNDRAAASSKGIEDLVLVVKREFPFPRVQDVRVMAARVRDADGKPDPVAARAIDADILVDANGHDARITIPASALKQTGEYAVTLEGVQPSRVAPLKLVVDPDPPRLGNVRVADANGSPVAPGGWSRTQDVVVTVDVADLSLTKLTLGDQSPTQQLAPGSDAYTFRMTCKEDGDNSWSLVGEDAAGSQTKQTVLVKADWTPPSIVELKSPAPQAKYRDTANVDFAGVCSELDFTVVVEGTKDAEGRAIDQSQPGPNFSVGRILAAGDHNVSVHVRDKAGNRSASKDPGVIHVEHVVTEMPENITWKQGIDTDMRKVVAGDVVIEGRTHPVEQAYLDKTEVTNAQYRTFLAAAAGAGKAAWDHPSQPANWSHVPDKLTWNDPKWNGDDLPVVNVAWWDAYAFAKWSGRRLPNEAEWVKAAAKSKEKDEIDLRHWPPIPVDAPWKEGLLAVSDGKKLNGPVSATASGDLSPAGCLHMGGNVSEWVDLRFVPKGEMDTGVRGGNWFLSRFAADARTPAKRFDRSERHSTIGFRCAIDAEDVKP